jgi:AraC-like DNA-binding protein
MGSPIASSASDWVDYSPRAVLGSTLMRAHVDAHQFERHSHDGFSIGLTTSGVQCFHCDGALHASLPGDLILFNPDQAHDGHKGAPEGFGYTILQLPVDLVAASRDAEAGIDFPRHFRRPVARAPDLARAFAVAVAALEQPGETLRGQELLTALVAGLLAREGEDARVRLGALSAGASRMNAARDYLAAHFERDVGIAELAAHTGLSRAHLTRAFSKHFGVPPHVWLNSVRLSRARALLLHGDKVADVAAACGFADQSHFARRFKGAMGLAPGQWVRQMERG